MDIFVRSWKGEASLAAAFWLVYVIFGIILGIIVSSIFRMTVPTYNPAIYSGIVAAICFPYTLFSAICVWRCAKNSIAIWRVLARIIVALGILFGILNLVHLIVQPAVQSPVREVSHGKIS